MVAKNPANHQAHFGLANEAVKEGLLDEALRHYEAYLAGFDDEGNGWARMADVLDQLGRDGDAIEARRRGIEAAERHGHPGMAAELRDQLDDDG